MFISELDVVNEQLASLGEAPLNSLDDEHPFVAAGLRSLRVANAREQAKGWWFNRETVELPFDPTSKFIYVPSDTISIDPASQWTNLVQRGRRLYDPAGAGYAIGRNVVVTLLRLIPFEDLPEAAATYISLCAQQDFQKNYDADRMKVEQILIAKKDAWLTLRAEDIRNVGANLLYKPSTLARMNHLGGSMRPLGTGYLYTRPGGMTTPAPQSAVDLTVPDLVEIFEEAADGP